MGDTLPVVWPPSAALEGGARGRQAPKGRRIPWEGRSERRERSQPGGCPPFLRQQQFVIGIDYTGRRELELWERLRNLRKINHVIAMKASYESPSAQTVEVQSEQIICESPKNNNVIPVILVEWGELS